MKSEYKNGRYYIYFPGRMWVVWLYLIFTPIYGWWELRTGIDDWWTIGLFLFFYFLLAALFVLLYHPTTVVIDAAGRKIVQTKNYYIFQSVKQSDTGMLTKIILQKNVGKNIIYLLWGFSQRKEFMIGGQICPNDYNQAKEIGQKIAELLNISFNEE